MAILTVDLDVRYPFLGALVPADATVLRGRSGVAGDILALSAFRDDTQITASVVEPVSVDVIAFEPISVNKTEQCTVHTNAAVSFVNVRSSNGVPRGTHVPAPLIDKVGVCGIDQCIGSNAAIAGAERDMHGGIIGTHQVPPALGVVPRAVDAAPGFLASIVANWRQGGH